MKQKKPRFYKSKAKQGVDACIFELALTGKDFKDLDERPLMNLSTGKKFGTVKASDGKATVVLVLPQYVRGDNIQPFTLSDSIWLEMMKNDCDVQLREIFGENLSTEITKIEVNITQQVSGNATQSDVMNLLSHATLSDKFDNVKYVGRCKYDLTSRKEETHTIVTRRPHYWVGKFYDKTEQMMKDRIENNLPTDNIPFGLLRIEIILIERTLQGIFGTRATLSNVLTKKNLTEVLKEYKRIFCEELVDGMIKPYLNECRNQLVESLTDTESPVKTIAKHRELIPDVWVLKKALERYMSIRGVYNNSSRDAKRYQKDYDLPQDVILTIHDFKASCG